MRTQATNDRGAVAIMVGMLSLVLVGMAAFSVDLGARYDSRRGAQAAVDIGLLSGAQDIPFGLDTASERIASEIRANLEKTFTNVEWNQMWTISQCSDDGSYDTRGTVGGVVTDCISFDDTGRARVKLPDLEVKTFFAGLFGQDTLIVGASAEAFVRYSGIGGVLPFTVLGGAEDGSQLCLRSSSGGTAIPPCDGSESGNFNALQVSIYGDPDFQTDTIACNTNDQDVFTINVAVGIDHLLRVKTGSGITDSFAKPFGPNQFYTDTGLGNGLWEGLVAGEAISGSAGDVFFTGPLSNISSLGDTIDAVHDSTVHTIDNTALWKYIPYGLYDPVDVPESCTRETFEMLSFTDATANIGTCLTDYLLGDYEFGGETVNDFVPLFTEDVDVNGEFDIEDNPRFAIVPQSLEEVLPRGHKVVTIAGFKAVWVQGLYYPNGDTPIIMEPGQPEASVAIPNGGSPLDQVTGWLLPDSTVDAIIGLTDEAGGEVSGSNVIELIG